MNLLDRTLKEKKNSKQKIKKLFFFFFFALDITRTDNEGDDDDDYDINIYCHSDFKVLSFDYAALKYFFFFLCDSKIGTSSQNLQIGISKFGSWTQTPRTMVMRMKISLCGCAQLLCLRSENYTGG